MKKNKEFLCDVVTVVVLVSILLFTMWGMNNVLTSETETGTSGAVLTLTSGDVVIWRTK